MKTMKKVTFYVGPDYEEISGKDKFVKVWMSTINGKYATLNQVYYNHVLKQLDNGIISSNTNRFFIIPFVDFPTSDVELKKIIRHNIKSGKLDGIIFKLNMSWKRGGEWKQVGGSLSKIYHEDVLWLIKNKFATVHKVNSQKV